VAAVYVTFCYVPIFIQLCFSTSVTTVNFDVELHLRPRFRGAGQRVVRKVTKSVTTCAHVVRA
jgi:hypothetical protein